MKFNYQARTKEGEMQTGSVEASSGEGALTLLQNYGLTVTLLEQAEKEAFYKKDILAFRGVSGKDVVVFSRQFSIMFKSRIPLVQVLQTLAEQTSKSSFREHILTMAQEVEGGTSLSQALAHHPNIFSPFYINLVKSGEASGTLSESLDYLADHLEREYFLVSRIRAALIYPAVVLVVFVAVLVLMAYFIIPQLAEVLLGTGQELPAITVAVIYSADFIRSWGWALMLFFIAFLIVLFRYIKTPAGKTVWDRFVLHVPLVKTLLKMIYVSRFAENLATLTRGGLPISQALEITGNVIGNESYKKVIFGVRNDVRKGETISRLLRENPFLFPPMLTQMVMVGEQTGTLEESLMNVVRFYRGEIERSTESFVRILEPLLVIFLGGIVGLLVAALFIPLYRIPTV